MTEPKPPESTNTNVSWKDTFLLEHPLSRLPNDEVRGAFSVILENGQGVRDYYSARYDKDGKEVGIPDEKFDVGIGKDQLGDSPRKQLIHEIGNTRLRAESLRTGVLKNWRYQESHSEEFTKLSQMSRSELIRELDASIAGLYEAAKSKENLDRKISLPFGKETTGQISIFRAMQHKILHLGILIASSDCIGDVERPDSVKEIWG